MPVADFLFLVRGCEGVADSPLGNVAAHEVDERRREIELVPEPVVRAGFDAGPADDQGDPAGLVVGELMITVDVELFEVLAVIAADEDKGIFEDVHLLEGSISFPM